MNYNSSLRRARQLVRFAQRSHLRGQHTQVTRDFTHDGTIPFGVARKMVGGIDRTIGSHPDLNRKTGEQFFGGQQFGHRSRLPHRSATSLWPGGVNQWRFTIGDTMGQQEDPNYVRDWFLQHYGQEPHWVSPGKGGWQGEPEEASALHLYDASAPKAQQIIEHYGHAHPHEQSFYVEPAMDPTRGYIHPNPHYQPIGDQGRWDYPGTEGQLPLGDAGAVAWEQRPLARRQGARGRGLEVGQNRLALAKADLPVPFGFKVAPPPRGQREPLFSGHAPRIADNYQQDTRNWPDPTEPRAAQPPEAKGCTCQSGEKLNCPIHGMNGQDAMDQTWSLPENSPIGYPQDTPRTWTQVVSTQRDASTALDKRIQARSHQRYFQTSRGSNAPHRVDHSGHFGPYPLQDRQRSGQDHSRHTSVQASKLDSFVVGNGQVQGPVGVHDPTNVVKRFVPFGPFEHIGPVHQAAQDHAHRVDRGAVDSSSFGSHRSLFPVGGDKRPVSINNRLHDRRTNTYRHPGDIHRQPPVFGIVRQMQDDTQPTYNVTNVKYHQSSVTRG